MVVDGRSPVEEASIPSSARTTHFSALAFFLASERCSLVIEPLNLSERALCVSD
jgi:hypothetical protein